MYPLPSAPLCLSPRNYRNLSLWTSLSRTGHAHLPRQSLRLIGCSMCGFKFWMYRTSPCPCKFCSHRAGQTPLKAKGKHKKRLTWNSFTRNGNWQCSVFWMWLLNVALEVRVVLPGICLSFTANSLVLSIDATSSIFWERWKVKKVLIINMDHVEDHQWRAKDVEEVHRLKKWIILHKMLEIAMIATSWRCFIP